MFVKERPKSAYAKFSGSSDKIINDLVNMGKKGLKDNEGKLASIIDNLTKNHIPIDPKALNPGNEAKNIHVHLKRSPAVVIKPNEKFQIVDGGLNFNVDKTKLIFAYYMSSYKLNSDSSMYMKLNLSGREIPESRQALGNTKDGSLSGAFAEVYYPNGKAINLNLYFKTSSAGKITDQGEDNFTIGALTMPVGGVYKHVNSQPITFKKVRDWTSVPNFELSVNFKDKKDYYFLIFYNFSLKMEAKYRFSTRMVVDTKPYTVLIYI